MSFQTPMAAILAGAIALPLLLLLYFLKLRRAPQRIASTLLWRKAIEDLQVNAPFQRLRLSLLLLIQFLILALLVLALGGPVTETDAPESSRMILLIDRSASMNATDASGGRTRFEAARQAARDIVARLGRSDGAGELMVITFGASAHAVSGFESNQSRLLQAIDSIASTDEPADLAAALELVDAFSGSSEAEDVQLPVLVLISDGGVEPAGGAGHVVRAGAVRFVEAGPATAEAIDNLGIVTFDARRSYEEPTQIDLFVQVLNAGVEPIETSLSIRVDNRIMRTEMVSLPAASDEGPGEASVSVSIVVPEQAVVQASLGRPDALTADNIASLVVPSPGAPRILIVSPDGQADPYVQALIRAVEPESLRVMSLEAYAGIDRNEIDGGELADFIVHDRVSSPYLPAIPTLTIGAGAPNVTVREASGSGGRSFLSWDRRDPMMRQVELDNVVFANFGGYDLPDEATVLATGPDGPVIARIEAEDARHVLVGFTLGESTWPIDPSILVFLQNVMDQSSVGRAALSGVSAQTGDAVVVRVPPGIETLEIDLGNGPARIEVDGRAIVTLPVVRSVGVYRVDGASPPWNPVAFNLRSRIESDIRPRPELGINAEQVRAGSVSAAAPLELWPWFAAAGLVLLVIEWLIYAQRSRL